MTSPYAVADYAAIAHNHGLDVHRYTLTLSSLCLQTPLFPSGVFLLSLRSVCAALVEAGVFPENSPPNHVLLNEYSEGQGIGTLSIKRFPEPTTTSKHCVI